MWLNSIIQSVMSKLWQIKAFFHSLLQTNSLSSNEYLYLKHCTFFEVLLTLSLTDLRGEGYFSGSRVNVMHLLQCIPLCFYRPAHVWDHAAGAVTNTVLRNVSVVTRICYLMSLLLWCPFFPPTPMTIVFILFIWLFTTSRKSFDLLNIYKTQFRGLFF